MNLDNAIRDLAAWIEKESYQGWDPFDALNSPFLKKLAPNRFLAIAWVQLLKRSPWNLRPILGIKKEYNPKGMGLFLASYLRKYLITNNSQFLDKSTFFAQWLVENVSPGYSGACWGYNFPWPNRGFFAPPHLPTIVNTSFIGFAFLDLADLPGREKDSDWPKKLPFNGLDIARSACEFIQRDLNRLESGPDEVCFSYTPIDRRYVHNANVLGAALLARVGARINEQELLDTAFTCARYTVRRQGSNGEWLYGEGNLDHWVDNFHTGFVLIALKTIAGILGEESFHAALERGYRFWKSKFFLPSGAPRYRLDRTFPIDSHCVAQAILTFLAFRDVDAEGMPMAEKVAAWCIENMQSPGGWFHYQHHRFFKNEIPYMRWSQAWMQRALIELLWVHQHEDLD